MNKIESLLSRTWNEANESHPRKNTPRDDSFVITSSTSGWVLGNILIGGLIGCVILRGCANWLMLFQVAVTEHEEDNVRLFAHVKKLAFPYGRFALP